MRRPISAIDWLLGLLGGALIGCASTPAPRPTPPATASVEDTAERLARADRMTEEGPEGPDLEAAIEALRPLVERGDDRALWRSAEAHYLLTLKAPSEAGDQAGRCITQSEPWVSGSKDARLLLYFALCLGARAKAHPLEGAGLVKRMKTVTERAIELDPSYLGAGAWRILGGIYLHAPAWPISVGDLDLALEHLREAAKRAPNWAENHIMLAEALLEDGDTEGAERALTEARRALSHPSARGWADLWKRDLETVRARLAR